MDFDESRCPACGQPIDYCQGHGESGDPEGFRILQQHDAGNHADCDPEGCDEAPGSVTAARRQANEDNFGGKKAPPFGSDGKPVDDDDDDDDDGSKTANHRVGHINYGLTLDQHFLKLATEEDPLPGEVYTEIETGEPSTDVMWPVELTDEEKKAKDAANVAGVATPGGPSGYPQPTASRHTAGHAYNNGDPIGGGWGPKDVPCTVCGKPADDPEHLFGTDGRYSTGSLTPQQAAFRRRVQAGLKHIAEEIPGANNISAPACTTCGKPIKWDDSDKVIAHDHGTPTV
jgi:hypothetical protein